MIYIDYISWLVTPYNGLKSEQTNKVRQMKKLTLTLLITGTLAFLATIRVKNVTHQAVNIQEVKTKPQCLNRENEKLRSRIERVLLSEEMIKKWREGHM